MVADTHSFSAEPRAANNKYRDDAAYYANIHFDKRVHRGSNYSKHQPGGAAEGNQEGPRTTRARRRPEKQVDPFSIEIPKPERLPIDLLSHLVEKPSLVTKHSGGYQTDVFREREPEKPFQPKRTGVDATTHICEGDLFDFDVEVEPLCQLLCSKTIEQAWLEVTEENESQAFATYKKKWTERRVAEKREEAEIVEKEVER